VLGAIGPAMPLLPPLGIMIVASLVLLLTLLVETMARHWRLIGRPVAAR
jgi:hypothetical protein